METIVVTDGNGRRFITQEAKDVANALITQKQQQVNSTAAIQCLLNDLPYELYWYNKGEGAETKTASC